MSREILSSTRKALKINLDKTNYGTIAEIGAGQETVRFFFIAGGAAGTVAKSLSAYDMTISDAIYGAEQGGRYVSQSRLKSMLKKEYCQLQDRLCQRCESGAKLFAFANTVTTKSYSRPNAEAHGWLGIRFQHEPGADEYTECVIHIRLTGGTYHSQQETVGVVGVNLIFGVFYLFNDPRIFIESLVDNILSEFIEIDYINFDGPGAKHINPHLACLHLIRRGLTHAIIFDEHGKVKQPADILYKRPTLIQRGSFRPITYVNMDMQNCAIRTFMNEPAVKDCEPLVLMEITMNNLRGGDEDLSEQDFLDRINLLTLLGNKVLITNFQEHYLFANYIVRNSRSTFALVLGISNLREVLKHKYYENLDGGILEACGKLFSRGGRLYIYPEYNKEKGELMTAKTLRVSPDLNFLFQHLLENKMIVDLEECNTDILDIYSKDVLSMIQSNTEGWENFVPEKVVEVIKINRLWGA